MARSFFEKPTDDAKTLKGMGDAIINQFGTLKSHIHIWLCSCSLHAIMHNDHSEIERVLDGCGDGLKRKAIYQWLSMNKDGKGILPFVWVLKTEDTKAHLGVLPMADREAIKARYEADKDAFVALLLGLKPWHQFDKANETIVEFDLEKELAKLLNKATKYAGDEKARANPKIKLGKLADLMAIVKGGASAAAAAGQQVQ